MKPVETLYTLREAQQELQRRECARRGHQYEHIHLYQSDGPVKIVCDNCGKSWKVVAND